MKQETRSKIKWLVYSLLIIYTITSYCAWDMSAILRIGDGDMNDRINKAFLLIFGVGFFYLVFQAHGEKPIVIKDLEAKTLENIAMAERIIKTNKETISIYNKATLMPEDKRQVEVLISRNRILESKISEYKSDLEFIRRNK